MKIFLTLAFVMLGIASVASAQTGALVSAQVQIYLPGVNPSTGTPTQTNSFTITTATCNQAVSLPSGQAFNPTKVQFDDRVNTGKFCIADQSTFLLGLPTIPGNYLATVTVTDDRGLTSARSAASNPFARAASPAVPTGLLVAP